MTQCLISGAPTDTFISFGRMPIANGFLTPEQIPEEYFFELKVGYCAESQMVQLTELVDRALHPDGEDDDPGDDQEMEVAVAVGRREHGVVVIA